VHQASQTEEGHFTHRPLYKAIFPQASLTVGTPEAIEEGGAREKASYLYVDSRGKKKQGPERGISGGNEIVRALGGEA